MFTSAHFLEKICVNVLKCRVSFLGSVFKTFTLMHSYVSIFDHTKRAAIEHALNVKPGQSLTNPGLWSGSDVWMASPLARFWSKIQEQEQEQDLEQAWSKIEIASTFHTYLSNRLKRSRRLLFEVFLTFFLISFALFMFSKKQNNAKWDCSLFIRHSFTSAFSFVFVDVCFAHSTLFHVFYLKSAVPCDDSPAVSPGLFWLV